jgi:N-acetylglucosamine-6-sulfatase
MPHVEALERRGTSFSHYFVVDSLCCPSRSAIFTGQYPHDDGVFTNTGADGGYDAFNHFGNVTKTFGSALQKAGYRTGLMGKYLNGYDPSDGQPPGWDEWDVAGDGYPEYDYELDQDGLDISYGHDPGDYLTDVLSARAGGFIDQQATSGNPFALEVATFAPHRPATPAPRDRHSFPGLTAPHGPAYDTTPTDAPPWLARFAPLTGRQTRLINRVYRKRVQSAQAVDDLVAHLEQRLRADGLARNTYFVFSSDNGFHTGEYRLLPGKQTAFDTDIKVPLVVAGPGVPAGRTVTALASSIDLAPTFERLGAAAPTGRPDGVSLLPLLHGAAVPAGWQRAVLIEHHGPDMSAHDPDRQPPRAGDPPSYEAIRTATSAYVEYYNGEREYYDLTTDPDELHNIASTAPPATLAALHRTLTALEHCHGSVQCQAAAR